MLRVDLQGRVTMLSHNFPDEAGKCEMHPQKSLRASASLLRAHVAPAQMGIVENAGGKAAVNSIAPDGLIAESAAMRWTEWSGRHHFRKYLITDYIRVWWIIYGYF